MLKVLRLSILGEGEDKVLGMAEADPDSSVIGGVFAGEIEVHLAKEARVACGSIPSMTLVNGV